MQTALITLDYKTEKKNMPTIVGYSILSSRTDENKHIHTGKKRSKFKQDQNIIQDQIINQSQSKLSIPWKKYTVEVNRM